jgi:type IV pilus assembly protein PilY1
MKKLLVASLGLVLAAAGPSFAGAVLSNGSGIKIGVNDEGHLNYSDGTPPQNSSAWGVAYDFAGDGTDYRDATSPGCWCEGWGVDVNNSVSGGANADTGVFNVTVAPFSSTASTATSAVELTSLPGLTVTHAYEPSSSSSLFQATVTIANNTGAAVTDVTYRRVMDWDVPPTEFHEWVSIGGLPASALLNSHDNGFCNSDILDLSCAALDPTSDDANYFGGPRDHGALFDFGFGTLADGASVSFNIFYGAALGESGILAALASVGTEVYSLGYSSIPGLDVADTAGVVYGFGFAGVGGTPIEPVPEPGTMFLLGSGVAALVARRRRKV